MTLYGRSEFGAIVSIVTVCGSGALTPTRSVVVPFVTSSAPTMLFMLPPG